MSLDQHVRTLGRGPGRSRSLTQDEAFDAMRLMLQGDCAPEAVGALLMLLRMKGETAQEIAGMAAAAHAGMAAALPAVDLDWPSYAAGRTRGAPWFLLSARLVADAGHRVLLHGWNGTDPKVRAGLKDAGIRTVTTPQSAAEVLDRDGIAYLPMEAIFPALFRLLDLRQVLGLRSCMNTVCRMWNPAAAKASVQGVFHPSYRGLMADAASLLGWANLTVIKGGGGEFERHPAKEIAAIGLRDGAQWAHQFPAIRSEIRPIAAPDGAGELTPPDPFDVDIITGTAAIALHTLGVRDSVQLAQDLWASHATDKAA